GQCSIAQRATGSTTSRLAPGLSIVTTTFMESARAGVAGSMPRMPRSSDSLSTSTSTEVIRTPVAAARMPISEARHDAAAARKIQPGDGALSPPPMPFGMPLRGDYSPRPAAWARKQAETYEETGGEEAADLRGRPIIVLTSIGAKTGKVRKTALMRVEHEGVYAVVGSLGGAPKHPVWY